jgi:hypothetical protein
MSNPELEKLKNSFKALLNKESDLEKELNEAFEALEKKPKAQNNSFEETVTKSKNSDTQKSL